MSNESKLLLKNKKECYSLAVFTAEINHCPSFEKSYGSQN